MIVRSPFLPCKVFSFVFKKAQQTPNIIISWFVAQTVLAKDMSHWVLGGSDNDTVLHGGKTIPSLTSLHECVLSNYLTKNLEII